MWTKCRESHETPRGQNAEIHTKTHVDKMQRIIRSPMWTKCRESYEAPRGQNAGNHTNNHVDKMKRFIWSTTKMQRTTRSTMREKNQKLAMETKCVESYDASCGQNAEFLTVKADGKYCYSFALIRYLPTMYQLNGEDSIQWPNFATSC
jgi:hypothetical protein